MAPDQPLLVTSGQVFLQGLYPPQTYAKPSALANGEIIQDPVNGLQFTTLHTMATTDPNTIWLKADDGCPNYVEQSNGYLNSPEFLRLQAGSQSFYNSLKKDYLNGVFRDEEIGYQGAYSIFDYINVGSVHNVTIASKYSRGELSKLKILADRHEWAMNGNASSEHPALTIAGKAMAYKVAERLAVNLQTAGEQNKFTLMVSSYDAFLGFFGNAGLSAYSPDFMGLPNYAASMVFEMFSTEDLPAGDYPSESDLRVRFLFRNGTENGVPLSTFPIFGRTELSWKEFNEKIDEFAVKDVAQWCEICGASESFCPANSQGSTIDGDGISGVETVSTNIGEVDTHVDTASGDDSQPLSPGVAGAVGAVGAIALILLGLGVAMAVFGVRFGRTRKATTERDFNGEKLPSETDLANLKTPEQVYTSRV